MKQYIDKAALVAEIERRISVLKANESVISMLAGGMFVNEFKDLLSFIDTLEVKEDKLFTETKLEKELAECYLQVFDKKFGNKLPKLKGTQLHDFKNFINTCEQIFRIKYFDYHATQGKLFEKLALLWAVWGKEHLSTEVKEVDLEKECDNWRLNHFLGRIAKGTSGDYLERSSQLDLAKHFFELGIKAQKGE